MYGICGFEGADHGAHGPGIHHVRILNKGVEETFMQAIPCTCTGALPTKRISFSVQDPQVHSLLVL